MSATKTKKLQINASEKLCSQLEEMSTALDATSISEVIRKAIAILAIYIEYKSQGYRLLLVKDDSTLEIRPI